jgi:peptidoglycan/xylan/chitin deacetylase (PgdA/CDA1 family)
MRGLSRRRGLLASVLWLPTAGLRAEVPGLAWPGGAQAAVSLGYDDGLASHLDHVVPALNRRRLRASFYLPINNPTLPARQAEWRAAARAGHELGNHSLFHACSASKPGRDWVLPQHDLDRQSPEQVQEQVIAANTWLQALDGQRERSYTLPCLDHEAGGRDYVQALRPHFVGIRARSAELVLDPRRQDLFDLPVFSVEGWSGERLIALVEQAASARALVLLVFHGVGAEHLSVTTAAHDALLDHLARERRRFWTERCVEILRFMRREQGQGLFARRGSDALPLKSPRARREEKPGLAPGNAEQRRARAYE